MALVNLNLTFHGDSGEVVAQESEHPEGLPSRTAPGFGIGWIKEAYEDRVYVAYHGNYPNLREASISADWTSHDSVRAAMCSIAHQHYRGDA